MFERLLSVTAMLMTLLSAPLFGQAPDIWVVSLRTGGARQITNHSAADEEPDWAPSGQTLLFDSNRHGNNDIFVVNLDGTNLRQLTTAPPRRTMGLGHRTANRSPTNTMPETTLTSG